MSTEISVECWSICQPRYRPIYRSRGAQNTHDPQNLGLRTRVIENNQRIEILRQERWINTLTTARYLLIVGWYVDHHSADISVDTLVNTSTDTSRSTYRPTLDRYVDRHIGWHSAAMSTEISTNISVKGCTKCTWSTKLRFESSCHWKRSKDWNSSPWKMN